jgi:hypothetical protein
MGDIYLTPYAISTHPLSEVPPFRPWSEWGLSTASYVPHSDHGLNGGHSTASSPLCHISEWGLSTASTYQPWSLWGTIHLKPYNKVRLS